MQRSRYKKTGNQSKILFKMMMQNNGPKEMKSDHEIIELMHPITRSEIQLPIRNSQCRSNKICIWSMEALLKEAQDQFQIQFKQHDISAQNYFNGNFTCKMCQQQKYNSKVSYSSFYHDRKLDYLIKLAKQKYIQQHKGYQMIKKGANLEKYVQKNFKSSKLFVYKTGGVILEFKKQIEDGMKVSFRVTLFQNNVINYPQKLVFNPRDYLKNMSSLKIAQSLAQHGIGKKIAIGMQQTLGCYSKQQHQSIKENIQKCIKQSVEQNIAVIPQEDNYCARISISRSGSQKKIVQLIIFYPRSNITQIFSLDDNEQILKSCQFGKVKLIKLPQKVLIYTNTLTFIVRLVNIKQGKKMYQKTITFTRPIEYLAKVVDKQGKLSTKIDKVYQDTKISYLQQQECYYPCPQYQKFSSIKDVQDVFLIYSGKCQQIFMFGGNQDGKSNKHIYKLIKNNNAYKWQKYTNQKLDISQVKFYIQENSNFYYLFMKKEQSKLMNLYDIYGLQISQGELRCQKIAETSKYINSDAILPFKMKQKQYILLDLRNKQKPLLIDMTTGSLTQISLGKDIMQYFKNIYDINNQQINAKSYPANTTEHNEVNYTIICDSILNLSYKIVYGCDDKYLISELNQILLQ